MAAIDFKEEYTKQDFRIKGIKFHISKIPAFKSHFVFLDLCRRFKNINIDENSSVTDVAISGIKEALNAMDQDYLESKLEPAIFSYINFDIDDCGGKAVNLLHNIDMIESKLTFDDIIELLIRGLCVNFLESCLDRLQRQQKAN